jgi:hypothetical protein
VKAFFEPHTDELLLRVMKSVFKTLPADEPMTGVHLCDVNITAKTGTAIALEVAVDLDTQTVMVGFRNELVRPVGDMKND